MKWRNIEQPYEICNRICGPVDCKGKCLEEGSENHSKHKPVKAVVVLGSPSEGFSFVGPFDSWEDADEWTIKKELGGTHIALVHGPEEHEYKPF